MGLADSFPGTPRNTIDYVHAKIHGGESFVATHSVSVGTATAVSVLITPPMSERIHLDYSVEATNSGTWTFSEAPGASGGSALVSFNRDRDSSNSSGVLISHTVTYASSGTVMESHCIGTAGHGDSSGGSGQSRHEFVLSTTKQYLLRFVAFNAATNVAVNLSFYEC